MSSDYPEYFYKYRPVDVAGPPSADRAISALLKNEAVFSSRRIFNDLFDSKIELLKPSPRQFKIWKNSLKKSDRRKFENYCKNGRFTTGGEEYLELLKDGFEKLIDSYLFFCVSKNSLNNLLWAHYASSHHGFCIEFRSQYLTADKVTYQKATPRLEILKLLKQTLKNEEGGGEVGDEIWSGLRTKQSERAYEEEYRFQAGDAMKGGGRTRGKEQYMVVPYSPEFIQSVIFGRRMSEEFKRYIVKNMTQEIQFKQVVETERGIEIVASNLRG